MPAADPGRGLREIAFGQSENPEAMAAQAAEHVSIGIMFLGVFGSESGRRNARQQAQRRCPTSRQAMLKGAKQEGIEAGRRVGRKIDAPACVFAFIHDGASPGRARKFQRAGLFRIVHGGGCRLGFWFAGFGLSFGFRHKFWRHGFRQIENVATLAIADSLSPPIASTSGSESRPRKANRRTRPGADADHWRSRPGLFLGRLISFGYAHCLSASLAFATAGGGAMSFNGSSIK